MTPKIEDVHPRRPPWLPVACAVGVVLLGLIVYNARYGAVSPRIRYPNDTGAPHLLSDPLFGYGHWIVSVEIFSYLALVSIIAFVNLAFMTYGVGGRPATATPTTRKGHHRRADTAFRHEGP